MLLLKNYLNYVAFCVNFDKVSLIQKIILKKINKNKKTLVIPYYINKKYKKKYYI